MKISTGLAGEMSGSMGGITASHNRGGAYLRRRSIPVNPNTARQQLVKSSFGGLVQAWSNTLTEGERQTWRNYAANTPRTDSLGNTITLTGQQWYIAANTPREQAFMTTGEPAAGIINAAPSVFNTGEPVLDVTLFEHNTIGSTLDIEAPFSGAATEGGVTLLFIGAPQNAGVQFFKGPYQLAAAIAFVATDTEAVFSFPTGSGAGWFSDTLPWLAVPLTYFPLRLVNTFDDGRLSQSWAALTQVTVV